MKFNITSLSKEDIVTILADSTYGENRLSINVPEEHKHLYVGDTWEDCLANVLINGGCLDITDNYSEEIKKNWEAYGTNYQAVRWQEFEVAPWISNEEQGKWGHIVYTVNLDNFIKGCNTEEGLKYVTALLIEKDGDCLDAYNLMQMILFEELIYG